MESEKINFEIIDCICSWYDLLGFGDPLIDSAWDLTNEKCKNQLKRVTDLDLTYSNKYSSAHGTTTFSLNDGIITNYDIDSPNPNSLDRLVMVIDNIILEFESLNVRDKRAGFPGVRGVITYGHRYHYTHMESTMAVLDNSTVAYHPRVFQMNTAFSKAYIIESSGSKAGVSGSNLYIDNFLLNLLEDLALKENIEENKFIVEKSLHDQSENKSFSIFRNKDLLLKLEFDKDLVDYNNKGIKTKLFKFKDRISRQDQLANEAAFREGQRYSQMERDEFGEN